MLNGKITLKLPADSVEGGENKGMLDPHPEVVGPAVDV